MYFGLFVSAHPVHVDGVLEPTEIVRELGKVTCDERLGRVGGDLLCTVHRRRFEALMPSR